MDLMRTFLDEIVDEIKKEEEKISDLKNYILTSLLFNKYFVFLYFINLVTFILTIIILIILILKSKKTE